MLFCLILRYDAYSGLLYLVGRVANDYTALLRIFSEVIFLETEFWWQTPVT